MECKNCGSKLRDDAVFCTNCGTRVEEVSPQPHKSDEPTTQRDEPQQQFEQQSQGMAYNQPYPPYPVGVPMPEKKKKSKAGLIIGLILGGIVLITGIILLGLFAGRELYRTGSDDLDRLLQDLELHGIPTPETESGLILPDNDINIIPDNVPEPTTEIPAEEAPQTPPPAVPDERLFGEWEFDEGDSVFFFLRAELVRIIDNGDNTFQVFESDYGEWGTGHISYDGYMIIDADWGDIYEFSFEVDENTLSITDVDGDTIHYNRME